VAEEVVRCAPCPVLTVRQPHEAAADEAAESDAEPLLVPVDFSDHAQLALQHAKGLSRLLKRPIELLHVVEETLHPAFYGPALKTLDAQGPEMDQRILEALQTLDEQTGPAFGTTSYLVRYGHPARDIIQVAEEGRYGLVVMGTHGLTGMERFFMGSVAEKVLRRVPCPVFTIKSFGRSLVPTTEDEQTHLTSM
ncbi:MAG: universal stress protein, partial [Bacteroidota bacterium]